MPFAESRLTRRALMLNSIVWWLLLVSFESEVRSRGSRGMKRVQDTSGAGALLLFCRSLVACGGTTKRRNRGAFHRISS